MHHNPLVTCVLAPGYHEEVPDRATLSHIHCPEWTTHLVSIATFSSVVDAVFISVEFLLQPGNEDPTKNHSSKQCHVLRARYTMEELTAEVCCQYQTNHPALLALGVSQIRVKTADEVVTTQSLA